MNRTLWLWIALAPCTGSCAAPAGLAVADLDNDAALDIIVACSDGIVLLRNNGFDDLEGPVSVDALGPADDVAAFDGNNDDLTDLVIALNGQVVVLLSNP